MLPSEDKPQWEWCGIASLGDVSAEQLLEFHVVFDLYFFSGAGIEYKDVSQ